MPRLVDAIETTAKWIVDAKHVVAFTGAGISTASGLNDYRGPDGVWTRRDKGLPPPPSMVGYDEARPNEGHLALVDLARIGKLAFLISQNVDGLHVKSGFPVDKLAELHGNRDLATCVSCDARYRKVDLGWDDRIHGRGYRTSSPVPGQPACPACGGRVISSIVNFEDPLPARELEQSTAHSKKLCDLFIVLGSSLVVNPAARMPLLAKRAGARLVINNAGKTPYDHIADLLVPEPINAFLPVVANAVARLLGM